MSHHVPHSDSTQRVKVPLFLLAVLLMSGQNGSKLIKSERHRC